MANWELARLVWETGRGGSRFVAFTHQPTWEPLKEGEMMATVRRLVDSGFELVSSHSVQTKSEQHQYHYTVLWFKRANLQKE